MSSVLSRYLVALALALGAVLAAAGCSTNEVVDPLAQPGLVEEAKRPPLPIRVLVAPLLDARARGSGPTATASTGAASPTATASAAGATETAEVLASAPVPQFDRAEMRAEIVGALEKAHVFAALKALDPPSSVELAKIEQEPSAARYYESIVTSLAYQRGEDAVLSLRLLRYDVSYLGTDTHPLRHYLSIFAYFQTPPVFFPGWFIADADFACDIEIEATLTAVASERRVLDRHVYSGRVPLTLDQFERGISVTGPLAATWWLDEEHWKKVANVCAPPARAEAELALVKDLRAPDLARRLPAALAGRYSVSFGVGHFDSKKLGLALLQAEEDAKAMHDLLISGGAVPLKNAVHLTSGSVPVTKAGMRKTLERAVARAASRDDLLYVVFAGYGASAQGEPLLVPTDFDPDRPLETGFTIRELREVLDRSPAQQVILVDASFGGSGEKGVRTLALPAQWKGDESGPAEPIRALRRERRVVVLAAGPTGQAHSTDQGHGNFTGYLLEEVRNPEVKADEGGMVTLNAIFDRVRRDTRAAFDPPQDPVWLSLAAGPRDKDEIAVPLARAGAPRIRSH